MRSKFYLFCAAMIAVAVVFTFTIPQAHAADPALKCEAGKLKESGKFGLCRLKAEAKGIKKGLAPDFTKCETKFTEKFNKIESKAGPGNCLVELDEPVIKGRVTQHADDVATLLAGGTLTPDVAFPASGQITAFGAGSDGNVQAGAALSYTDNGDGTITDNNTGLMWEKKDNSGGIHGQNVGYSWSTGTNFMDGTIITVFLNTLNDVSGGGANCFAGHCDWRIPNAKELQSIVDYEVFSPPIAPAFHQAATCTGCSDVTLPTCSCTAFAFHWSSTSDARDSSKAWFVDFNIGGINEADKIVGRRVRAVRSGS